MRPTGQLVRCRDLTVARTDEMYVLMQEHYVGMDRARFDADLSQKIWSIEIVDPASQALVGFSTLALLNTEIDGKTVGAVFSGDTIINKQAWGQLPLFQISGWFLRGLMEASTEDELYWFLISKGYKTYRFLPVFFHEFLPHYDATASPHQQRMMHQLGSMIAPGLYDPESGIIRADDRSYRLRPGIADLTPHRLNDPHVQHFNQLNPNHSIGDELCCLAPLSLDNFTAGAFKAMGSSPPPSVVREFPHLSRAAVG